MKKLVRLSFLFVIVALVVLMATACSSGEADSESSSDDGGESNSEASNESNSEGGELNHFDTIYEVTYPDGKEGVIDATNTPQASQCRYFEGEFRDFLGKYVERNAGVDDADLESWCLDHYEDRGIPEI